MCEYFCLSEKECVFEGVSNVFLRVCMCVCERERECVCTCV